MTKTPRSLVILALAAVLPIPFLASTARSQQTKAPASPSRPTVGPAPARKVRIGLTHDPVKVRVSAEGGIVVRDPVKRAPIWRPKFSAGLYVVSEVTGGTESGLLYRVQLASFADKAQAEAKQAEIAALLPDEKVVLVYHPDRRSWRVRVGEFLTREDAAGLMQRLNEEGHSELWIAEEGRAVSGRRRIRLVDDRWRDFLTEHDRVLIEPLRPGTTLRLDAASYRGVLEARVAKDGNLRVINELDMEEYLRGVVPNEMGPGVYPELQALKAQAVAARTYIVANLGQFSEDGYDVCDSPQCQVYRGASSEHPLTDQAVAETRGLIVAWSGKPINALYTSTCGGHTEDGRQVFPNETGPYLKGVPCYPEVLAEGHTVTGRTWVDDVVLEDGLPVNEEITLLHRLGVAGPQAFDRAWLLGRASPADTERWAGAALRIIGKSPARAAWAGGGVTLQAFAGWLVRSLGWEEKMQLALDDRDLPYLLAFKDRDEMPPEAQRPFAVLILEGIVQPFRDNTLRPRHHPSRGLVLRTLFRVLDFYDGASLVQGTYRGTDAERILIETKEGVAGVALAPEIALFRSFRDVTYPAQALPLVLGDRLRYHVGAAGAIDYLKLMANQRGVSDDRYSSAYRWEQRYTRAELEALVGRRVHVGRLIDVEPTRRGVSGRVVEVRLIGSRGQFRISGFPIRTALGVRENLFTIDRMYDADGKVAGFIFSGKGWGHGVGLCQVGAYGMALRGKTYDEILRHYYGGAEVVPAGSPR